MDTWKCQIRKGGFTFSCGKDGNSNDPKLWLLQKINDTYPAHQEVWENRHLHLQQPKINTQKNNLWLYSFNPRTFHQVSYMTTKLIYCNHALVHVDYNSTLFLSLEDTELNWTELNWARTYLNINKNLSFFIKWIIIFGLIIFTNQLAGYIHE